MIIVQFTARFMINWKKGGVDKSLACLILHPPMKVINLF